MLYKNRKNRKHLIKITDTLQLELYIEIIVLKQILTASGFH